MKTLKTFLAIAGGSFLGCSILCALINFLQNINMPTAAFGYTGLAMLVCFLLLEVSELRSNEEIWEVFRKCVRSDIAAINAKISDLLMPGGAKKARHEMLKQWILAHYIEAVGKARIDFSQAFTASFGYRYQGKWSMSTVKVPAKNLASDLFKSVHGPCADMKASSVMEGREWYLFESTLAPYADMMASIVMEGRDWDLFDFDDASAFFEEYHDPMENFISVSRNGELYKKDFAAVMNTLGFTETVLEPVPGKRHVMYAGKHANLTEDGIKLFNEAHERAYPGRGEVLLYL